MESEKGFKNDIWMYVLGNSMLNIVAEVVLDQNQWIKLCGSKNSVTQQQDARKANGNDCKFS